MQQIKQPKKFPSISSFTHHCQLLHFTVLYLNWLMRRQAENENRYSCSKFQSRMKEKTAMAFSTNLTPITALKSYPQHLLAQRKAVTEQSLA